MKAFSLICLLAIVTVGLIIMSASCGWFGKAADVVSNEIDPQTLQNKYEWFKDASAQLDAFQANIALEKLKEEKMHCDTATDRVAVNQCSTWMSEEAGLIAGYNYLAAQYNSEMSKWNWRFTNVGDLPKGADKVLPREYRPYESN